MSKLLWGTAAIASALLGVCWLSQSPEAGLSLLGTSAFCASIWGHHE